MATYSSSTGVQYDVPAEWEYKIQAALAGLGGGTLDSWLQAVGTPLPYSVAPPVGSGNITMGPVMPIQYPTAGSSQPLGTVDQQLAALEGQLVSLMSTGYQPSTSLTGTGQGLYDLLRDAALFQLEQEKRGILSDLNRRGLIGSGLELEQEQRFQRGKARTLDELFGKALGAQQEGEAKAFQSQQGIQAEVLRQRLAALQTQKLAEQQAAYQRQLLAEQQRIAKEAADREAAALQTLSGLTTEQQQTEVPKDAGGNLLPVGSSTGGGGGLTTASGAQFGMTPTDRYTSEGFAKPLTTATWTSDPFHPWI